MAYRDEGDATAQLAQERAEVARLRSELTALRGESERVRAELHALRARTDRLGGLKASALPTSVTLETWVPGTLAVEDHPALATAIEAAAKVHVTVGSVGNLLVISSHRTRSFRVEVAAGDTQTTVRVSGEAGLGIAGIYGAVVFAATSPYLRLLFRGELTPGSAAASGLLGAAIVLAFHLMYVRQSKHRLAETVQLAKDVERAVSQVIARRSALRVRVEPEETEHEAPIDAAQSAAARRR